jgi:hypothetical protein
MALGSWYQPAAHRLVGTILTIGCHCSLRHGSGHEALVSVSGSVCVALRFGL